MRRLRQERDMLHQSVCWLQDAFSLQQVSAGVHGCVQVGENGPDIH